ncbi:MAG TPA: SRPBCC family protein [Stellaceae bacterium]|nr:SRPBCC family protein [Stellaceae bacterium]
MTATITAAPVRKTITVKVAPDRAFEVFTAGMSRWWPQTHSINASPLKQVIIEPRAGGRWYERGEDGSECQWGKVLAWEPPTRLVLAWQIGAAWKYDPSLVTELELRFIAEGAATRVELEHRGLEALGAQAEQQRAMFDSPNGWSGLLERFASTV